MAAVQAVPRQLLSVAHEACERNAVHGRQPFARHPLCGAAELQSNTPFPGWGFRALRSAGEVRRPGAGAKREGHLRFPSLFELLPFPRQPRERALRLYFVGNSHKGTGIGFRFPRCCGGLAADCTGFA